ncbi:uncharacterized protein E6C27_scaffold79G001360 [Cucumis melo var. makuwa]|uniref:Uncharacterized protein n=1 Tax=Cucumis melo var. makuwa TaxID=1194695 RepID=A0A5A7V872_CUCMM|nr:uncharacterized protein E6C27_scaffold79G001360 [Cucumis melo var. makuwa]
MLEVANSFHRRLRMRMYEICETVLGRRPGYSKGLGWGPKPKSCKSCASRLQFCNLGRSKKAKVLIEQHRLELEEAKRMIEEQRMTSELHTQLTEEMKKSRRNESYIFFNF